MLQPVADTSDAASGYGIRTRYQNIGTKKKAEHRSSSAEQQRALAIATNNQFPAANQDKPPNEVSRASPTTMTEAYIC